jgi:hypothetical protein
MLQEPHAAALAGCLREAIERAEEAIEAGVLS